LRSGKFDFVAQYLSQKWFDEMTEAAATYKPDPERSGVVSLRETITGSPFDDVTYVMTIGEEGIDIAREPDSVADVTFTQDYDTAVALHRGELTTHDAFFAGKVRVAGHLNTLLEHADLLQGITSVFEPVRNDTTY
jgi:putative sterol carrier protein